MRLGAAAAARAPRRAARVFGGGAAAHVLAPTQGADEQHGDQRRARQDEEAGEQGAVGAGGVEEGVERVHEKPQILKLIMRRMIRLPRNIHATAMPRP